MSISLNRLVWSATVACISLTGVSLLEAQVASHTKGSSAKKLVGGAKKVPAKGTATQTTTAIGPKPVSIQCTDTEVAQVLKGLSLQSGANIVIGSGVSGKISLDLHGVTVTDALDYVCSMANIRYAKIGTGYIVTTPERFEQTVAELSSRTGQTRVVKIVSLKSDPARVIQLLRMANISPDVFIQEPKEGSAGYLSLVGPEKLTATVELMAKDIDAQIASTKPEVEAPVAPVPPVRDYYEVQTGKASSLKSVLAATPAFSELSIISSPEENPRQVVILEGSAAVVKRAKEVLGQLDGGSAADELKLYDVSFVDPRSLREHLVAQVPGLRVSVAPVYAANPGLYNSGESLSDAATVSKATVNSEAKTTTASTTAPTILSTDKGSADGITLPFQGREQFMYPMRLILRGSERQVNEALALAKRLDTAPKQVALELRVMELSREQALKAGLKWDISTGGAVSSVVLDHTATTPGFNSQTASTLTGKISGAGFSANITATLDSIANRNNLIARPNILAVDGRETEIFIGDVIRYIESYQQTQNGVTVTTKELPVGVRLAVIARIGANGAITLDLRPAVSTVTSYVSVTGGGNIPQTSVRVSQSTMSITSGDTIAIGGLIQEQDLANVRKVPVLGNLPILGQLFRQTTKDRTRSEVVFFLTAREVTPANQKTAADPRQSEKSNPGELPTVSPKP